MSARGRPSLAFRRTFFTLTLIALLGAGYALVRIGPFLTREDVLQKGDVIAVLAGTKMDRPLEAFDLYRAGYAPLIVLTRNTPEASLSALAVRGVTFPAEAEETRDVLVRLGVPASAIVLPQRIHDNTAQEARTFRELAKQHGWRRVIVVTSHYHLRRAAFAIRRELEGTGIEVVMRGTRYETIHPDRWWTTRSDVRWVLDETAKLIAYWFGLGA